MSTESSDRWKYWVEAVLVCLTFAALAAGPVPEVNESHYWTKAKSFWDSSYGSRDLFLQSADAHYSFYLTLGWLAAPLPLETAVWTARWIVWAAMAAGWTYLSRTLCRDFGVAILSGGLLVVLTRWFHLAGEWVVGGAEAKGLAFACAFAAIGMACQKRWAWAWILGGAAAAFHVLVGGWIVLAMLMVAPWYHQRSVPFAEHDSSASPRQQTSSAGFLHSGWSQSLAGLFLGGLLSLPGLIPAVSLNWGVPKDVALEGARIYSIDRIAHHLSLWAFQPDRIIAFSALLLLWIGFSNLLAKAGRGNESDPLQPLVIFQRISMGSILIAAIGAALGVAVMESDYQWTSGVQLLRFYWFRCSDVLVPAFVAIAPFALLYQRQSSDRLMVGSLGSITSFLICLTATALIFMEGVRFWSDLARDPRPAADRSSLPANMDLPKAQQYYKNWVKACHWARDHTPEDSLFLTPRSQQTFKWYAERAEVLCWKDIPQDSLSMLRWMERARNCFPHMESEWGFAVNEPEQLEAVIRHYQVDYLLIPQYAYELKDRFGKPLPYPMVYPASMETRSTFVILDVRPAKEIDASAAGETR